MTKDKYLKPYRLYTGPGFYQASYGSVAAAVRWGKTLQRLYGISWYVNDKSGKVYARSEEQE